MDTTASLEAVQFGSFRLDCRAGQLLRRDARGAFAPVPIGSRALELLRVLVDHAGQIVPKQTLMDTVWPGTAVEESNLTVQISTLRHVLDAGRTEGSCIQTVTGRGYRFTLPVTPIAEPPAERSAAPAPAEAPGRRWPIRAALAALVVALFGGWWLGSIWTGAPAPRFSLVVLPFANLGGDPTDNALADGVTADLTNDITRAAQATVTAQATASAYKGRATDIRALGRALRVRYVLEGSVRRVGASLKVDGQLTSAETGTELWSDRFDEAVSDPATDQERIVSRLQTGALRAIIATESARSFRERPNDPDAFDLVVRARAIALGPPSLENEQQELGLYERALGLDPANVVALVDSAYLLTDMQPASGWQNFADMQRAGRRLAKARELAPEFPNAQTTTVFWLQTVGRCPEAIELAHRVIETGPDRLRSFEGVRSQLGVCLTWSGHAEEEIKLQEQAMEGSPRSPWVFSRYGHIGRALLLLGRDQEAIASLQHSLALEPEVGAQTPFTYRSLAAAYARTGQMEAAHHALAEADRLFPHDTARGHCPNGSTSDVYRDQVRRLQDALRLAGERDHADEDADFGVASDRLLHGVVAGHTPTTAPGAATIRTADLPRLLADTKPIVIDTMHCSWGRSLPGAIGLTFSGLGGDVTDEAQDRLRAKMQELTGGDRARPIVAVGWNAELFDGRNLALRLAALGYTHVYWYRGGLEAWEVAGLPEAALDVQDW